MFIGLFKNNAPDINGFEDRVRIATVEVYGVLKAPAIWQTVARTKKSNKTTMALIRKWHWQPLIKEVFLNIPMNHT